MFPLSFKNSYLHWTPSLPPNLNELRIANSPELLMSSLKVYAVFFKFETNSNGKTISHIIDYIGNNPL